jgi:hypothetical protein
VQNVMSALPPIATAKADSRKRSCRFTPESGHVQRSTSCPLWAKSRHLRSFDYFIGASEERSWRDEAKCLRGLEIDCKLELGRLFDWEISRSSSEQ